MQEILIRNLIIYIFLIINLAACNLIGVSSIDAKSMNNITLCVNAVTNQSLSKNDLSKLEAEIQNRDLDCNKYKQAIYAVMSSRQSQINKMQSRAMASAERIFQALDWHEQIREPKTPVRLPGRVKGKLEFRNLTFGYDDNQPVLKDVSFNVKPGEKLAIVGPTGSGKSTLIRLLGRFYDFSDDRIFLDGHDLNSIHSTEVRRRIGVVMQDFHIFSGSILENIVLGNQSITRAAAISAAKSVNAHEFIEALPDGYDTELVERGQNLSQGQRQLLAFARVLASDPEILILDEATASIDTETEQLIQEALEHLMQGRTSILIAHRLQTIETADRVLVLKDGKVKELGTHQELMALRGVYYTLTQLQFQDVSS